VFILLAVSKIGHRKKESRFFVLNKRLLKNHGMFGPILALKSMGNKYLARVNL